MNQAAVAHEGHYPETQVHDLALGKMRAQDVEGLLRLSRAIGSSPLAEIVYGLLFRYREARLLSHA
jgi:hypothetical protein